MTVYVIPNYKTKKALKEAVANGDVVTVFQLGPFVDSPSKYNGTMSAEGPHYPEPHKWYATITVVAGRVTKVK